MSGNNPILAIACGPIVTTWDISKSKSESSSNKGSSDADFSSPSTTSLPSSSSYDNHGEYPNAFLDGTNGAVINLASTTRSSTPSLLETLESMGIRQFRPHTSGRGGSIVRDVVWNHNGQVLATCSDAPPGAFDVALTLYSTQTKIESFSNVSSSARASATASSNGDNMDDNDNENFTAGSTSINFGGSGAKSRYVCISDGGGYISVWDMKKRPVTRVRHFSLQTMEKGLGGGDGGIGSGAGAGAGVGSDSRRRRTSTAASVSPPPCVKASMDRSDTFVVGLHGRLRARHSSNNILYDDDGSHVTLDVFHLKNGGLVTTLVDDGTHGGPSDCFHFSNFDSNRLVVGTHDGSLLLWDVSSSSANGGSGAGAAVSRQPPMSCLERRHGGAVTDVAFSPMNRVLAASCSVDGTVIFHDVHSEKKIQTLQPAVRFHGDSISSYSGSSGGSTCGLTSLAFHSNGYTWAVGTDNGYVLNYDLRQIAAGPLNTLNVGDGIEGGDSGDGNGFSGNGGRRTYAINKLQFSPVSSPGSSKTPKTVKKKQSPVMPDQGRGQQGQGQQQQQLHEQQGHVPISSQQQQQAPVLVTEGEKYATTKNEPEKNGIRSLESPQPSSSLVKELFHQSYRDEKVQKSNDQSNTEGEFTLPTQDHLTVDSSPIERHNTVTMDQHQSPHSTASDSENIVQSTSRTTSNEKIRQVTENDNTEAVIKSFDQMHERLKNRESHILSPQQDSGNSSSCATRKGNFDGSEVFMITKNEIQELVDDAVESLRDDMDDALQNMHCNFMRELQRQSDETKIMLEMQRIKIEKLVKENADLKAKNEELRLF